MSNIFQNVLAGIANALSSVAGVESKVTTIETEVENDIVGVAESAALYEAGKAVVLSTISIEGHAGKVVAVADGGADSIALGLSTAPTS